MLLAFNPEFGYTAAIKIEELRLILSLTNLNAEVIIKRELSYSKGVTFSEVIKLIIENIESFVQEKQISHGRLLGISVTSSGMINGSKGKIIRSTLLGWNQIDIRAPLETHFNVPVFLNNNVNAYAIAEKEFGFGKQFNNFICISIGTGVGTSFIFQNKSYSGHHGGAGEIGHMIISPGGYKCHCGQHGCLEMYSSEFYFQKAGPEKLVDFPHSILTNSSYHFDEVYKAAQQSDELALYLMKSLGENLGIGILNLINLLNPEAIIFIGEGVIAKKYFLSHTLDIAQDNFFKKAGFPTSFHVSQLGDEAWLQGAALSAIHYLFDTPIYKKSKLFR
ncbi:ROK family protein [Fictibacillus enclensis]|uniref:ROK family protein n=1 Tax=Fictibacillus enclensis TaxID=1017270 RepID=UPI0025A28EC1|nr:ROK family protein [Fictibacillus enclensis]MDM5338529.1 ROK family protein [Fictibacillus enclensis]